MASSNTHEPVRVTEDTEPYYKYTGPFKTSMAIANHYGFRPVTPLEPDEKIKRIFQEKTKKEKRERTDKAGEWYIDAADKLAEVDAYFNEMDGWEQPVMAAHTLHPRRKTGKVRMTIFGSTKSIAEGLILKATLSILEEMGHEDMCVDLNSLGTQESRNQFLEDFIAHYRDNLNDLGDCCQTQFKHDPLKVIMCDNDTCLEIQDDAPQPITYLTDETREHFKECIEYVETFGLPYRINHQLLGSSHNDSHTLFQIHTSGEDDDGDRNILARGERHEHMPKQLGYNRCLPTISVSIDMPGQQYESYTEVESESVQNPKLYYLHLGKEAKRESLPVLEQLREAGIPVIHSLSHDGLSPQMQQAKDMNIPYALIMGLKEVQEGSIILRDMFTRAQETIPQDRVATRVKKVVKEE